MPIQPQSDLTATFQPWLSQAPLVTPSNGLVTIPFSIWLNALYRRFSYINTAFKQCVGNTQVQLDDCSLWFVVMAPATCTLPDATQRLGRVIIVKNDVSSTASVTMGAFMAQTIDGGAASAQVLANNASVIFQSNGANWITIGCCSGAAGASTTSAPPPSAGTGGSPVGTDGQPTTSTPVPPSTPTVTALPDPATATVGNLVIFQGQVYRFTAPPSGVGDGYWALDVTGSASIRDVFTNLFLYPAANYSVGTIFFATDWIVSYAVQNVSGTKTWIYYNGIYEAPIASIPTALLGINDTSFTFRASDYLHSWIWNGTAWNFTTGGFPAGLIQSFAAPSYLPPGALWHLLDGSTQPISQNDGTLLNTLLATVANTYIVQ